MTTSREPYLVLHRVTIQVLDTRYSIKVVARRQSCKEMLLTLFLKHRMPDDAEGARDLQVQERASLLDHVSMDVMAH